MDLATFKNSLKEEQPPAHLSQMLKALWHEARGEWERAHELAQTQEDQDGAWIHAYLHRKEGDRPNAAYWYRRAKRPFPDLTNGAEWEAIVADLLRRAPGAPEG